MKWQKKIYLDYEVIAHINRNLLIPSFSDWVNSHYKHEFMEIEGKTQLLSQKSQELEDLKEEIKKLKISQETEYKETLKLFNDKELKWIKQEGITRLNKGATFEGVFKFFINTFHSKINRRQLRLFIDKLEVDKHGKEKMH